MDECIIEELKMNIVEEGIGYFKKISSESSKGGRRKSV